MKISLAPIPYLWDADRIERFYDEALTWPVDVFYLGEVVCAKRRALGLSGWLDLAARIAAHGKEVVLSTLTLLEAGSELGAMERLCRDGRFEVEANDTGAVHLLAGDRRFVAGAPLNIYNPATLRLFGELGAHRFVLAPELSGETLGALMRERPPGMECEVQIYGRLPLAYSARCFTARAHDLAKDECAIRCAQYPDGLALHTQEKHTLFTINGIQLQSAQPCNLLGVIPKLRELGVGLVRVAPQAQGTGEVVSVVGEVLAGTRSPQAGLEALGRLAPDGFCNGYWYGEPGLAWRGAVA